MKDEEKLRQFLDEVDTPSGLSRKRARLAENSDLNKGLYNIFVRKRNDAVPISGPILQSPALKFIKALNGSQDFKCSAGWLDRWKKRHGIKQVTICGESRSADIAASEESLPKFQELIVTEGYCTDQIFNADETALFYKMLPDKTLAEKDDKLAKKGFKQIKDRITILFACNWAGTMKLHPLAIGKFRAPRCFHHVNMNTLPVQYDFCKNAWMMLTIFQTWFQKTFVPTVRRHLRALGLEEKACLLLDNCPVHPPEDLLRSADGKIQVFALQKQQDK